MSKFDFHVHCYPEYLAGRALAAMAADADTQTNGTWDDQLRYMGRHNCSHCAVLNMATSPHSMHKVNMFALEIVRPGQMIMGSVHPKAENAIEELEWLYEQGIRGIKLHTGYQHFDFDDPANFPIYRRIGELGMITSIHCGPFFEDKEHLVWPSTVARAIEQFQGAPFVCAHMGGVSPDHPEFSILRDMPVYVDTALAPHLMTKEQFGRAVQELGVGRVLYGTDMPWENPEKLTDWIDEALAAYPEIHRGRIYYRNAMALCRKLMPERQNWWIEDDYIFQ